MYREPQGYRRYYWVFGSKVIFRRLEKLGVYMFKVAGLAIYLVFMRLDFHYIESFGRPSE
jgi:hypothetical protein